MRATLDQGLQEERKEEEGRYKQQKQELPTEIKVKVWMEAT